MMKYITFVGSRETPKHVLMSLAFISYVLCKQGFGIRSGHARGADIWSEYGCDMANGSKEIYLPWKKFEGSESELYSSDARAFELASRVHGGWNKMGNNGKLLHARNIHQVLGNDLDNYMNNKSIFTLCWTENGNAIGGTATAIKISKMFNVPCLNLGKIEINDEIDTAELVLSFMRNNLGIDTSHIDLNSDYEEFKIRVKEYL